MHKSRWWLLSLRSLHDTGDNQSVVVMLLSNEPFGRQLCGLTQTAFSFTGIVSEQRILLHRAYVLPGFSAVTCIQNIKAEPGFCYSETKYITDYVLSRPQVTNIHTRVHSTRACVGEWWAEKLQTVTWRTMGLDYSGSTSGRDRHSFLRQQPQTGFWRHHASWSEGNKGSFTAGNVAGTRSQQLIFTCQECVELRLHSPFVPSWRGTTLP
jgi:hypothetical protein